MIFDNLFKLSVALGAAIGMFILGGIAYSAGLGILGGSGLLPNSHEFLRYTLVAQIASATFGFHWGLQR